MRLLACIAMLAVAAPACAPPSPAPASDAVGAPSYEDGAFSNGDRVRVRSRSGTFKPDDTGHASEVNVTAGRTGAVMQVLGEIARVRFDAQTWEEFPPNGVTVALKEFEATINVSYLQALPKAQE